MSAISLNSRVFVAPMPLDFRKRIDGTHAACRYLALCHSIALSMEDHDSTEEKNLGTVPVRGADCK